MRIIRRIYFYLVALISLLVVVWGAINLARTLFDNLPGSGLASQLSGSLAMVAVGLPIFFIHWRVAQREAAADIEERASRERALFLYVGLFATLTPVVQDTLALINRPLAQIITGNGTNALVGAGQTPLDNVAAILINLIAAAYLISILRRDESAGLPGENLCGVRRLYRYAWLIYALALATAGAQMFLYGLVSGLPTFKFEKELSNGLAFMLVGIPLWVYTSRIVTSSLHDRDERFSYLRLGLLYLLTLVGMATCLIAAGIVLSVMLRWLLGDRLDLTTFINAIRGSFSAAIPFAVIWRLYRKQLLGSLKELNNPALMRLYRYMMALGGNIATFTGGINVLFFIAKSLFLSDPLGNGVLPMLCNGLAGLAIGLPVWLIFWNTLQGESAQMSEDGDFARRSTLRKVYLYLVLFLSVVGVMGSAGEFLYLIFNQALGYPNSDFKLYASESFFFLALVAIWLIYHLGILRQDGKQSQQAVAVRHAAFPVLVLTIGESAYTSELVHQLGRVAPHIPVAIHDVQNGAPDKELLAAKAIVLPGEMALQPFEALRLWLNEYKGRRLIAPENSEKWFWSGFQPRKTGDLARETAQNLRQMAEGQSPRSSGPTNPWVVVGYIFGGLFALQILFVLVILATSGGGA